MTETPNDEQHIPAVEPDLAQRNLSLTLAEGYAAKKFLDLAVPDAYGLAKAGLAAGWEKIHDSKPDGDAGKGGQEPPPPPG